MYEPDPEGEAGRRAFVRLLTMRSGYPRRGALAELARISDIPPQMLSKYIRGEVRPTDGILRKLAPALGMAYADLWQILHPAPGQPLPHDVPLPEVDDVGRLTTLLDEAQEILTAMRSKAVASTIDMSRRRKKPGKSNRTGSVT